MHAAIYASRAEAAAIVHTHSPRATALACAGRGIPPFHYMIALAGGDVRCMPYATFGTNELAEVAVRGLEGRRATLLGNHGVIACGSSLHEAHAVAVEVENLATEYLAMLAAGLQPQLLDAAELARVITKFTDYGRLRPMSDSTRGITGTEWLLMALGFAGLIGTWAQGFGYLAHGFVAATFSSGRRRSRRPPAPSWSWTCWYWLPACSC